MNANQVGSFRQRSGLSAAQLARLAGISRQTIYAIEGGAFVPNTTVALKLARALETTVEDLFALPDDDAAPAIRTEQVTLLPGAPSPQPGQPVQLCRVDRRVMATAPSPMPWHFPPSHAVVADQPAAPGKTRVQVFPSGQDRRSRILMAGCDPAMSVLGRHVHGLGIDLVLANRNSSQALALLQDGCVHIAGTHLRDNVPEIGRLFPRKSVAVVTFAVWEEGIVTARGNPKGIRGVADMARPDVTIVNRERGAGSRRLLDAELKRLGIASRRVRGYNREAPGHLPAAWQVLSGAADCCIATRGAARLFGLGFLPLASERYDLAIRRKHLSLAPMQTLLDTLSRIDFRRELESLGGYDTTAAGRQML
jgi:molybdate-binding protein/DNA-binding XRE family transcriptional regulator